ncbi:hypothetical protein GALMADRAFT_1350183 [Galerina marginata CBS 339.88]|uniref:Uncharacterized protein n=1 Tax=Galerina marginata (strain CBS 339.88) TaxID=685588 RepID=A0A067SHF6_GALM3|nr:hypothetical protein GALMADRAFT_1350183 [Galerina marginata CBS 339.88]
MWSWPVGVPRLPPACSGEHRPGRLSGRCSVADARWTGLVEIMLRPRRCWKYEIENRLKRSRSIAKNEIKMLLLGTGKSGKEVHPPRWLRWLGTRFVTGDHLLEDKPVTARCCRRRLPFARVPPQSLGRVLLHAINCTASPSYLPAYRVYQDKSLGFTSSENKASITNDHVEDRLRHFFLHRPNSLALCLLGLSGCSLEEQIEIKAYDEGRPDGPMKAEHTWRWRWKYRSCGDMAPFKVLNPIHSDYSSFNHKGFGLSAPHASAVQRAGS